MGQTVHMGSYSRYRHYRRDHAVAEEAAHTSVVGHDRVSHSIQPPPHDAVTVPLDGVSCEVIPLYSSASSSTGDVERPVRVMVTDGQALIRAGYRALLESNERIQVVAEASNEEEAIACACDTSPDVALLDLRLAGLDDSDGAPAVITHPAFAGVAVLLMVPGMCDEKVLGAVRGGAVGVLARDADPTELIRAVQAVARGQAVFPVGVVRQLLDELRAARSRQALPPGQLDDLTAREREVVTLVARGLSNNEIAARLLISPATAKTHVSRAMLKLGACHRAQLVALAYRTGLVRPPTEAAGR